MPTDPITLRYGSAEDVRRDRLPDVARGVISRLKVKVAEGEVVQVRMELARERITLDVRARVRWATPLAIGALVGLELEASTGRERVQLDLMLGLRTAGAQAVDLSADVVAADPAALPRLSVALLEPSRVLREVLSSALVRFARTAQGWDLQLDGVATPDAFLAAMAERRRNLAVVDCDGLGPAADPLIAAVRARPEYARMPLVLLSRTRVASVQDRWSVTMQKPVHMKSLLHTTGILLRG